MSLCFVFLGANNAFAGDAKVVWGELEKFTDIRSSFETKEMFNQRLMKEFNDVFSGLAKQLPSDFTLEVNIYDIDLAGEVRYLSASGFNNRIVRGIDWPKISFEFVLKNDKGTIVAAGKEDLKDMNFLNQRRIPSGRTSFDFEEKMLQDWFRNQQREHHLASK